VSAVQVLDSNNDKYIAFDEFARWWAARKAPKGAAAAKETAKGVRS
jgi:hypothetical protein